jgi:hypothetical protein
MDLRKADQSIAVAMVDVHRFVGDKQDWFGKQRHWRMSDEGALKAFDAKPASDAGLRILTRYNTAVADRNAIADVIDGKDDIYASAPWSRFFEVTSSNGHIHSHLHCSTCNPRTTYGWWPELSGLTEADAVAKLGPILCSVCYPSAPTEWKLSRSDVKAASDAASGLYCDAPAPAYADVRWNVRRTSGWAECTGCDQTQSVTTAVKFRKHKKPVG